MSTLFPIIKPILVKLLPDTCAVALQQHGCSMHCYPGAGLPAFGHMVTFPKGTQMDMKNATHSVLIFPDGYKSVLIWEGRSYCLYETREESAGDIEEKYLERTVLAENETNN